jgi:hypothetical protein
MLSGDRKWAAWMTMIQTAAIDPGLSNSQRQRLIADALMIDTECLSGVPYELSQQAAQFVGHETGLDPRPQWLKTINVTKG